MCFHSIVTPLTYAISFRNTWRLWRILKAHMLLRTSLLTTYSSRWFVLLLLISPCITQIGYLIVVTGALDIALSVQINWDTDSFELFVFSRTKNKIIQKKRWDRTKQNKNWICLLMKMWLKNRKGQDKIKQSRTKLGRGKNTNQTKQGPKFWSSPPAQMVRMLLTLTLKNMNISCIQQIEGVWWNLV